MIRKMLAAAMFALMCGAAVIAGLALHPTVVAVAPAAIPVPQAVRDLDTAAPTPCAANVLADAKTFLHADPDTRWIWAHIAKSDGAWGLTWHDSNIVALDVSIPCEKVFSVVAHEWAHTQVTQDWGMTGEIRTEELVADCVSALLRPNFVNLTGIRADPYSPYAVKAGGFSPEIQTLARSVLDSHF